MATKSTHTFYVHGMHCAACTVRIEQTFTKVPHIDDATVSLADEQVTVVGEFAGTPEEIAAELTELVRAHGNQVSLQRATVPIAWGEFAYALPIAVAGVAAFILLQKVGLTNLVPDGEVSYGTAFLIGLVASVSSCLAVVGGLLLSLTARSAQEGNTWRAAALFHVGRLGGFLVLGGLVGLVGSALHLGPTANLVLGVMVALVMVVLGVNLLEVVRFTKRLQLTVPKRFSVLVQSAPHQEHYLAPLLVGVGTFFLPCGFTQSMQLYALSTGSVLQGATLLLVFALGTFPMLAVLSFSSFTITTAPWKGVFYKTAGLVVIALALFNLAGVLAAAGLIEPLFAS